MLKFFSSLILFISLLSLTFSATIEIDSCQGLGSGNTYIINNSFQQNISSQCFSGSNAILDCQDNFIVGNMSGRFWDTWGPDNITIQNCNIQNFYQGFRLRGGATNMNMVNITISNTQYAPFYLESISYSKFENINIYNSSSTGIIFLNGWSDNNILENVFISNSSIGIAISGSNNSFNNIDISNTLTPIQFQSVDNSELLFSNSNLGNTDDWTLKNRINLSSTTFQSNTYSNFNNTQPFCFYSSICDSSANNYSIQSTQFPSNNILLSLFLLILFFLFN